MIDANENRAREALRVLEDIARFTLNDSELCTLCKDARHGIRNAMDTMNVDRVAIIAHRDTPGDVGTTLTTQREFDRSSLHDIACAAGKRAGEALRALEESMKAVSEQGKHAAAQIEAVRYCLYEIERRVILGTGAASKPRWRLCVLVTESICTHATWQAVVEACIEAGVDAVQLREKALTDKELCARARWMRSATEGTGTALVVNDRVDIAAMVGADAVHLGQDDARVSDARRIVGSTMSIGVSTTNLEQAQHAIADGADVCGVGPVYPTHTKQTTGGQPAGGRTDGSTAGLEAVRAFAALVGSDVPWMCAIGGITRENAAQVIAAGADGRRGGIAVCSAVCGAQHPKTACKSLLSMFDA